MTQKPSSAPALVFHDTTFHPVTRQGEPWLPAAEIAAALGYARENAVSRIYARHKDEFTVSMSQNVNLTLRGAHLLGMFARTERAAEFRRWVLDVLDGKAPSPGPAALPGPAAPAASPRLPYAGPPRPSFDLRAEIHSANSTPTLPLPRAVRMAINHKAWDMAREAYELFREHLARRVAHTCEVGDPRRLDEVNAFIAIATATLDEALAPRHHAQLASILSITEAVTVVVQDHLARLRRELNLTKP